MIQNTISASTCITADETAARHRLSRHRNQMSAVQMMKTTKILPTGMRSAPMLRSEPTNATLAASATLSRRPTSRTDPHTIPVEITQDPMGIYRNKLPVLDGRQMIDRRFHAEVNPLANVWARNIRNQDWHNTLVTSRF